jgi:hypothetical protein
MSTAGEAGGERAVTVQEVEDAIVEVVSACLEARRVRDRGSDEVRRGVRMLAHLRALDLFATPAPKEAPHEG